MYFFNAFNKSIFNISLPMGPIPKAVIGPLAVLSPFTSFFYMTVTWIWELLFSFSAKVQSPLHWGLKLAISPWAGRLWSTFRWAASTLIISHNVSTHGISQVVCCASHSKNAADTSLHHDINFHTESNDNASWIKYLPAQVKLGGNVNEQRG